MQTETQQIKTTHVSKRTAVKKEVIDISNVETTTVTPEVAVVNPPAIKKRASRKSKTSETTPTVAEKPKRKRNKTYFGAEQEAAFVRFINSTDQTERDRIFTNELEYPLTKLIECIIRRYQLFTVDEDYDETFHDAMSYLIFKSKYFDPSRNFKAYSFCGTVVKNYLILKRTQSQKAQERNFSYDWLLNDTDLEEDNDGILSQNLTNDLFSNAIDQISLMIKPEYLPLFTEKEIRVAYALLEMLQNHEEVFKIIENSTTKFNKISSMYFIQEYTQLSPADVREAMKLFKEVYGIGRQGILAD